MIKKSKPKDRYQISFNRRGSLIGEDSVTGVRRTGAHMYKVPSETTDGISYTVYVEKLDPKQSIYRCSCMSYLTNGKCKHGPSVLDFESFLSKNYPDDWKAELKRREETRNK